MKLIPLTDMTLLQKVATILLCAGIGGCGLVPVHEVTTDSNADEVDEQTLARFYIPYAAMAARVYHTEGRSDDLLSSVASSSWLRQEIASSNDTQVRSDQLNLLTDRSQREQLYRERVGRRCDGDRIRATLAADDSAVRAAEGRCRPENADGLVTQATVQMSDLGQVPTHWEQCQYSGGKSRPMLPLKEMTEGWEVVPELQRSVHPRGWSIFVPGLAIDVWRQRLAPEGEAPVVEYALVFRGTSDGGGWVSNFRVITAFTPLVWDQYNQAQIATTDLINQIYQLHALSDALFSREADTRIRITAVGHSLGGGLSNYVFLRIPQITRVVSFDPSPINGSSMFSPKERSQSDLQAGHRDRVSVMLDRKQPAHRPEFDKKSNIFVLYEKGDVLTKVAGCTPGAIWGAEGGPIVRCDEMNLSAGNPFQQHNMPQLACKLFLFSKNLPTRE